MPYQIGSQFLAKMDTAPSGGPTFTTIGAFQSQQVRVQSDTVDVTNQDSPNKWRELLAGAGIKRSSFSGRGVFNDTVGQIAAFNSVVAGTIKQWQMIIPAFGTLQGLMQVTQCELSGDHAGEVQYSLSLESAGEITFTAA